jgi:hypothetical protein
MKPLFIFSILIFFLFSCNSKPVSEAGKGNCYDTIYPVIYNCGAADNGDYAFRTIPARELSVQLIPNLEARAAGGVKEFDGISGIHEFLLDHDLTTGFVHPYTTNMYNKLQPADFVLRYKPDAARPLRGRISFIRKSAVAPTDTLGRTLAYFRQWKLSALAYKREGRQLKVLLEPCNYYPLCACPQGKPDMGVPEEIPIWHGAKPGEAPVDELNGFGRKDGGTVVIVWAVNGAAGEEIWFQDINSSWKEILETAIAIAKKYNVDPAICISDSGPFTRKLRADNNHKVYTKDIDAIAPHGARFGAGYGYTTPQ